MSLQKRKKNWSVFSKYFRIKKNSEVKRLDPFNLQIINCKEVYLKFNKSHAALNWPTQNERSTIFAVYNLDAFLFVAMKLVFGSRWPFSRSIRINISLINYFETIDKPKVNVAINPHPPPPPRLFYNSIGELKLKARLVY